MNSIQTENWEHHGRPFFKHQVLAVLIGPLMVLVCTVPIGEFFRPLTRGLAGNIFQALPIIFALAVGYFLPVHGEEDGRRVARWTWILPLIAFIMLFAFESADFGMATAWKAFFEAEPPSGEGLATVLFTFPTISSIAYSMGSALSLVFSHPKDKANFREGQADITHHKDENLTSMAISGFEDRRD